MAIGVMRAGDACRGVFSRTRSRSRRAGKPCARLRAAALDAADGIGEAELQPQLSFEWGSGHWPSPQSVVKLVATDVDGTLLNSHHKLSQANIQAARELRAAGIDLLLATGKARGPWVEDVAEALGLEGTPGVFLQGLYVTSDMRRGKGEVIFERTLPPGAVAAAVESARSRGLTLVLYSAERIVCAHTDEHSDRLLAYSEPTPEAVGDLAAFVEAGNPAHKVIFMGSEEDVVAARTGIEAELCGTFDCATTRALEGMLELQPAGVDKAVGVQKALEHAYAGRGLTMSDVMAIGDGENDVALLAAAGVRCAMGNGSEALKESAHYVLGTNDEAGGWPVAASLAVHSQPWLAGI